MIKIRNLKIILKAFGFFWDTHFIMRLMFLLVATVLISLFFLSNGAILLQAQSDTHTNEPYWLVYNITPFFHWSTILFLYLYLLVRAVDHGNEHVEKNYHHSDIIDSIQHVANVLYELMVILQHHRNHFRQPEDWPEKSLETLLYPAGTERDVVAVRKSAHASDYTYKAQRVTS